MKSSHRPDRAGFSTRISVFLCLGILLVCASGAWAQTSTVGTVAGVITDESKAAVPGAEVKVTDTSTNISQTTISNSDGRYVFSSLSPGTYNISITKQGFNSYLVNAQVVEIGQSLTID